MVRWLLLTFTPTICLYLASCSGGSPPSTWPRIDGWQLQGKTQSYTKENLWDAIDGAADLYLEYGFIELTINEHEQSGNLVNLEVYNLSTHINAFGVYRRQRLSKAEPLDVGGEASISLPGFCSMFTGHYFVQAKVIKGALSRSTCEELLGRTAEALGGAEGLPEELDRLPLDKRIPGSERFTATSYLGLSEIGNVMHARYRRGSTGEYELFTILDKRTRTAEQFLKQLPEKWKASEVGGYPARYLEIPYRGCTIIVPTPKGIYGIVDAGTLPDSQALLLKLVDTIR